MANGNMFGSRQGWEEGERARSYLNCVTSVDLVDAKTPPVLSPVGAHEGTSWILPYQVAANPQ